MSYIEQKIAQALKRGLPFLSDTAAQLGASDIVRELGLTQFYAVDYGDGEMSEASWEHWDEARDHASELVGGTDLGGSKICVGWFTGWEPAENIATSAEVSR